MEIHYNLLSATPPEPPKHIPESVKFTTQNVPGHMKIAAYNSIFPSFSAYMSNEVFTYPDGVKHDMGIANGIIGDSGVGKNYIDIMLEAILKPIRLSDKDSEMKLAEWARTNKRRGANQQKEDRPMDAAVQAPDADISNPAIVLMLEDLARNGNKRMILSVSEVDMLDSICGSHKKLGKLIRNMSDMGKTWGQHRATEVGVSARPPLRLSINFASTTSKASSFFHDCVMDGTLWRLGISYVPKPKIKTKFPRQGVYGNDYYERMKQYLVRLGAASGEIKVPRIDRFVKQLSDELSEIEALSDNDIFSSMWHRSLVLGWKRGCMLYILEGYKYDKRIEDFVRWSVYYDLWSKIHVFAPQLVNNKIVTMADVKKYGPANLLDGLNDSFSIGELEELRVSLGKERDGSGQIKNWLFRGYITHSAQSGLYTKTQEYLKRHSS